MRKWCQQKSRNMRENKNNKRNKNVISQQKKIMKRWVKRFNIDKHKNNNAFYVKKKNLKNGTWITSLPKTAQAQQNIKKKNSLKTFNIHWQHKNDKIFCFCTCISLFVHVYMHTGNSHLICLKNHLHFSRFCIIFCSFI